MAMITKTLFPGRYMQGFRATGRLENELLNFGKVGLCIMAPSAMKMLSGRIRQQTAGLRLICEKFNRECCDREIERLANLGQECQAQFVVAVGGGKTIDTGKIVADRLGVSVAVVPTIASTDAPCSACAVVYSEEGVVVRVEYQKKNPDLVLVDSEIIANAPERFLIAGMGDALATARVAAILAAKRTSDLIPLCHHLALTGVDIQFEIGTADIAITATVRTTDRTGVEMEALTAVSVAALTLYDMIKAVDRAARIDDIRVVSKVGGRTGEWTR
ncbi:MAG: Cyclic pyranopterin monophosphate synthase accessory protein 2 [Firmicutes bacterium ADurb.Bin373]|nr:MAG: Cyclic pyranopterin monophosphate synthase accessory protein 2 [Firmicutes bacterium ADurb.Bin373]